MSFKSVNGSINIFFCDRSLQIIPFRSFPNTVKTLLNCEKLYSALALFDEVVEMNETKVLRRT